jgi:GntR family transcriptional regulator, vanillate catabolism transcriptional regulator
LDAGFPIADFDDATAYSEPTMDLADDALPSLKRTRLVDDVTGSLREMILTGRLQPGQLLRQVEVSEQLGVSRTPLREAFRVLERDGLIRSINGNNTVEVVDYSTEEILELYEVREVLDGLAARLLAKRGMTPDVALHLEQLLDEMEAAREPYDAGRYGPAHSAFHTHIVEECGNHRLQAFLPMIRMSANLLGRRVVASIADDPIDTESILIVAREQHRAIFDAIKSGDGRSAEATARRHIRSTMKSALVQSPSPASSAQERAG